MSHLTEVIDKEIEAHPDGSDDEIAGSAIARLNRRDLLPLLVDEVRRRRRETVRTGPERVFRERFFAARADLGTVEIAATDALAAFRELFGTRLAVGDGKTQVVVERFTFEQWATRREMLRKNIAALEQDVAICDAAMRLLRETGKPTLGDIEHGARPGPA